MNKKEITDGLKSGAFVQCIRAESGEVDAICMYNADGTPYQAPTKRWLDNTLDRIQWHYLIEIRGVRVYELSNGDWRYQIHGDKPEGSVDVTETWRRIHRQSLKEASANLDRERERAGRRIDV